jgi:hypothetical protein
LTITIASHLPLWKNDGDCIKEQRTNEREITAHWRGGGEIRKVRGHETNIAVLSNSK